MLVLINLEYFFVSMSCRNYERKHICLKLSKIKQNSRNTRIIILIILISILTTLIFYILMAIVLKIIIVYNKIKKKKKSNFILTLNYKKAFIAL